jgi:hypothetical protein
MKAIVTLRFQRNANHDPKNKVIGECATHHEIMNPCSTCTDSTGEHHSYIETGRTISEIKEKALGKYPDAHHVTRVEVIDS